MTGRRWIVGGSMSPFFCLIAVIFTLATSSIPNWSELSLQVTDAMRSEQIGKKDYAKLARGEIVTVHRPVPAGKTGVHVAAFGIIRSPLEKLWNAIADCERQPEFMPHVESCVQVPPDHPLPPNMRWDKLQLGFHIFMFKKTIHLITQKVLKPPHYLHWRMVKGDLKVDEGYYRIITLASGIQLLIYDTLTDPGISVPGFVKSWLVTTSLPKVIIALRNRVAGRSDSPL